MKIVFTIKELPYFAFSQKGGNKTIDIQAKEGTLSVFLQYDYNTRPLLLSASIKVGDNIDVVLFDHRIELYINGVLSDEEWPAGKLLFEICDVFCPSGDIEVYEYNPQDDFKPNIISTFECAEGWRPSENVFVGDCMPYEKNGEYHVLYLKDRHHHKSKWGLGAHQWEHISTEDFKVFRIHPTAIPISESWEGSICTGSWIQREDTEYLYYTVRRIDGEPAPILRCTSDDGYNFRKDRSFLFTLSDKFDGASARDPKVFLGDDGLFHMLLTTKLKASNRGCLAHCVSADMEKWHELDEPFYISPDSHSPECPDYFKFNSKYYLIFSFRGIGYYMISEKPFEDFYMPGDPVIPCSSVPKCAKWRGKLLFAGFRGIDGYGGTMTFKTATAIESGELIFD